MHGICALKPEFFIDMKSTIFILSVFVAGIIFYSCEDVRSYPDVPEIESMSYKVTDSMDVLGNKTRHLSIIINFADGDGNLSTPNARPTSVVNGDTLDTTTYSKIFLTFYTKINRVYTKVPDEQLEPPPVFIIPYGDVMQRNGQNKLIKGKIVVNYGFYFPMPYDTLKIKAYITDLAYNKSNTDSITDVPLTGD